MLPSATTDSMRATTLRFTYGVNDEFQSGQLQLQDNQKYVHARRDLLHQAYVRLQPGSPYSAHPGTQSCPPGIAAEGHRGEGVTGHSRQGCMCITFLLVLQC